MTGLRKWRDWSIRSKINAILIPALLPLVVMAWITYRSHGDTSVQRSRQLAQVVASHNAEELDAFLAARGKVFDEWTSEDIYGMGIEFHVLDETTARLRGMLAAAPEFCLLVLVDVQGKALAVIPQSGTDARGLEGLLGSTIPEASNFAGEAEDRVLLAESRILQRIGYVLDKTYVFGFPCRDSTGERNGVLLAYLDWAALQDYTVKMANVLVDNGFADAQAVILDTRTSEALTHSEAKMIGAELTLGNELKKWLGQAANAGETASFTMNERREYINFVPVFGAAKSNTQRNGTLNSSLLLTVFIPANNILAPVRETMWVNTGILAASVCFLLVVFWLISGNITRPIRRAADFAQAIAGGDLTQRIAEDEVSSDEVGELAVGMNRMAENLNGIVQRIGATAVRMEDASREQATGASNQSTATAQMSATTNELVAAARQMTESGASVSAQAEQARTECGDGTGRIQEAVQGIEGIRERVERIAEHMLSLGSKSQQISGVLDIINELSEQTNLLSLNASIEAAGAGEAGKRFAVVASEIRKLAERAAESTTEIRSLIDGIQETVNATIMATEEGSKAVGGGVCLTGEVQGSFERIANQVSSTTQSAKAIEMASRQQVTALEQIDGAVRDIDGTAQQSEAAARQVQTEAQALAEAARRFKTVDLQDGQHEFGANGNA
ncbi:MAG: methyl-accepting chemotaxis protein [bacterium]|nr:methyl-accepting chemotaxis protein [bacterium]